MSMSKQSRVKMFRDKDNKWRFRIVFPNGRIAATSEAYSNYRAAFASADSIMMNMLLGDLKGNVDESEYEKLKKEGKPVDVGTRKKKATKKV